MQQSLYSTDRPQRIVIIGAGFGGLSAALELGRLRMAHKKQIAVDVTVIDRNDFQLFTPDLYEIASLTKDIQNEADLKKIVCLNARLALRQQSVDFMHATVTGIDRMQQVVQTAQGDVPYDYLLLSCGSQPFYFGIPGAQEHTIALKWIQQAVEIRRQLLQPLEARQPTRVVICGAGPAGVEVAAEMMQMARRRYQGLLSVVLIDRNPEVLSMLPPRARRLALRRLQELGVTTTLGATITAVEAGQVVLDSGERVAGDVIIWTGGVTSSGLAAQTGLELDDRHQVLTIPTLQTVTDPRVFAIGDVAHVQLGDAAATQTAHEAVLQGPHAARNLWNVIIGKPLQSYRSGFNGFVVTLGGKRGLLVLPYGLLLSGWIGWCARKFVDFRHFRSVLPFMQACSVWYNGLKAMNRND